MILMKIKKFLNKFGYDIKKYHPLMSTTIKPLDIKTIIDIGANDGHYAEDMRQHFPQASIYSFEPLPDCYQTLNKAMAGDANFKSYNIALGDKDGSATIARSSFHPSSSLLPMATLHKKLYPKSAGATPEQITIKRLDDIIDPQSLAKNILIKMDVQGFEDKVIAGGARLIKEAAVVIIETSFVTLYENQPLFDDIYRLMVDLGFSYYGDTARHYSRQTDKLIYEDSVFIKKEILANIKP